MGISADEYVGYLRAQYQKASKWRVASFSASILAAVPALASIFTVDAKYLYGLTVLGGLLIIGYIFVANKAQKFRTAAQISRRAALISDGEGATFSSNIERYLTDSFVVDEREAEKFKKPDYYTSKLQHGSKRLLENSLESAFFSARLHAMSAKVFFFILIVYVISIFAGLSFVPLNLTAFNAETLVRIILALNLAILSADVVGAYSAHTACATRIDRIKGLIETTLTTDSPHINDTIFLTGEYSSAVESAPEIVPFAYKFTRKRLERDWERTNI